MTTRPTNLMERELNRIVRLLDVTPQLADDSADNSDVTAPEVASRSTSLTALRVIAIVGAVIAVGVIVFAFTRSVALGALSVAGAPIIPLTLVVVADRVFGR